MESKPMASLHRMSPQKKSCLIGSPRGLSTSCSGVARYETKTESESKITFVRLSTKTRPLNMFSKDHRNPIPSHLLSDWSSPWKILTCQILIQILLTCYMLHSPEAARRWSIALCLCVPAVPQLVPGSHRTGKYRRWRPRSDWAAHAETWTSRRYTWRRRRTISLRMRKNCIKPRSASWTQSCMVILKVPFGS